MREKGRNVCSPRLRRDIPLMPTLLLALAGGWAANKIATFRIFPGFEILHFDFSPRFLRFLWSSHIIPFLFGRDSTRRTAGATSQARDPTVILELRPLHHGRAAFRIFLGFEILHFDLSFRFRWFLLS
jgi:hypothetical protein